MEDLISRQAAIDAIDEVIWYHLGDRGREMLRGAEYVEEAWYKAQDVYKALENVPDVEITWIPCSKAEPEENQECWITTKTPGALYRGWFTSRYGESKDKGFITFDGFVRWDATIAWTHVFKPKAYRIEEADENC